MFRVGVEPDSLSLVPLHLQMIPFGSNETLATGTGFFYRYDDYYYLITNGHNVTRVHPETGERISNSMAFPVRIDFKVRSLVSEPEKNYLSNDVYADLYRDEDYQEPLWYIHPEYGYKVDVVAIPVCGVNEEPRHVRMNAINEFDELLDKYHLDASDDVFILGYPFALTGDKGLPIWKRGSVATEPGIDLDGLPKLLVDTATRPGMSGSPVIFKRIGLHGFNKNSKPDEDAIIGEIKGFVGVYSGRIGGKDELQAQLGIVWRKSVIEEILKSKVVSDSSFQKV